MKKIVSLFAVCIIAMMAYAVPAKRGWQTRTQADGTTIEVQQVGDEFYHYMINREGQQVREINGMYEIVGEAPTPAVAKARRAKGVARRQRKDVGTQPNLAPKGVVILANFKDSQMKSGHTKATFDELCNSLNCTVNSGYPSAGQYFADQSNGTYRPQFDVFGPVDLSRNVSYYGTDKPGEDEGDDQHATDAVVEACILANQQFTINWADYDSNNDGKVDFVYVIYAGKGQADGGTATTIWPHNWDVTSAISNGYCTYTNAQRTLGGKKIDNYAMSSELSGNALGGIGTLCHEFGHVMGLPDLYDTSYGSVYEGNKTPNDWNIMDGGSYNADGHCPPNYDPWEKDFFGWHTPINLGSEGQNLTLYANGTENYQAYQINASGKYVDPTTSGLRYYIENRQAQGWDAPLTGHGLLIWKVNFNATAWTNNAPNNSSTSGAPLYTIVSASGTKIGWDGETDNCPKNPFPGTGKQTSWSGVSGKPLLNIKESNQIVTLTYIEEPVPVVDPFELTWKADGAEFAKTTSTGKIVLPESEPTACEGKVFVGWTATENYRSDDAPTFVQAGAAITEPTTFYAVFATQDGEGGEAAFDGSTGGTFKIYAQVGDTKYYATSTVSNNKLQSTTTESEAADFVLTPANDGGFSIATDGKYLSNGSKTNVSLSTTAQQWNIEDGTEGTWRVNSTANTGRALAFRAGEYNVFGAYATSNINGTEYFDLEIGGEGGASYSNYSTSCGGETAIEDVEAAKPAAFKTIREGRIVIVRGDEEFNITGERIR